MERTAPRCHSHIKVCRGVRPPLKIRMLQGDAVGKMASDGKGQRVAAPCGH